jgi:hypothetical protein
MPTLVGQGNRSTCQLRFHIRLITYLQLRSTHQGHPALSRQRLIISRAKQLLGHLVLTTAPTSITAGHWPAVSPLPRIVAPPVLPVRIRRTKCHLGTLLDEQRDDGQVGCAFGEDSSTAVGVNLFKGTWRVRLGCTLRTLPSQPTRSRCY